MDPVVGGALISGAASLLGSLFGAKGASANVKATNQANLDIANRNNATSLQVARENNQMQLQSMRENNDFNRAMALEMFNLENAYNSPKEAVKRLKEGGLNPATLYGQGVAGASGSADGSTPSASASGISPSMPNLVSPQMQTPPSVLNTMFSNIESVSRSLGNVAKSALDATQKKRLELTMNAELQNLLSQTNFVKAQTAWQELQTQLESLFGAAQRDANLRKTINEANESIQDALLKAAQGKTEVAKRGLMNSEMLLNNTNNSLLKKQAPFLIKKAEEAVNLIIAQQGTEEAKQADLFASAGLSAEKASQLRAMRDDLIAITKSDRMVSAVEAHKANNTVMDYINMVHNERLISDAEAKRLASIAEMAEKENDTWYVNFVLDKVNDALNTASKFTGVGKVRDVIHTESDDGHYSHTKYKY